MGMLPRRLGLSIVVGVAVAAGGQLSWAQADDHGNNRDDSTLIDFGIAQTGTIEVPGDVDYFRVDLQGRANVQFRSTMPLDTNGQLYDSEGRSITRHDDIDIRAANFNFLIATELDRGVYYLAVRAFATSTGDYGVLARFDLMGDDHGDTFGSSTIVALGPRVAGNVNDSTDVDWFRVDFPERVSADIHTLSQKGVVTHLYYPRGDGSVAPDTGNWTRQPTTRHRWYGDVWEGVYYFAISGEVSAYNIRVETENTGSGAETVQARFDVPEDAPLVSTPATDPRGNKAADVE